MTETKYEIGDKVRILETAPDIMTVANYQSGASVDVFIESSMDEMLGKEGEIVNIAFDDRTDRQALDITVDGDEAWFFDPKAVEKIS